MHDNTFFIPIAGGLLALLCLLGSLRYVLRRRLVEELPTSKSTSVFIGLVELKGTAESTRPLRSYLAGGRCVLYSWSIEEHWSRTVTETYTDSDGKQQTRTRHESGWTTVASGGETSRFYLRDDCGAVRIDPDRAKIEPLAVFGEECDPSDALYYGKGPAGAVADSDHVRRFEESAIPVGTPLYVLGQARERKDMVAAEIAWDPHAPMFLITTRNEKQVRAAFGWGIWTLAVLGLVLAVLGVFVRDKALEDPWHRGSVRWQLFLAVGAAYAGIYAVARLWSAYNGLVDLRQRVRQAWSNVDVQLKRRADLIPNLVAAVTGIRGHERELQAELATLRSQLAATPPGVEGPDHRAVSGLLAAVVERYPRITAEASFAELRKNLVDTENRIALARGYFNEIAAHYNGRLQMVPDRWIAALAGLAPQKPMDRNEFEATPDPEAPPAVAFAPPAPEAAGRPAGAAG